jgi:hypothetical protein
LGFLPRRFDGRPAFGVAAAHVFEHRLLREAGAGQPDIEQFDDVLIPPNSTSRSRSLRSRRTKSIASITSATG